LVWVVPFDETFCLLGVLRTGAFAFAAPEKGVAEA
jgi:hypothetical protein